MTEQGVPTYRGEYAAQFLSIVPFVVETAMPDFSSLTERQREIYDVVLGAQQAAMQAFKAGASHIRGGAAESLDKVARELCSFGLEQSQRSWQL